MSVYLMHGKDGASLADLIGAADAMNHAIPTAGELTRALTRLGQCRVVIHVNDRYCIAPIYLPAIVEANKRKGGLFMTPDKGKKWLQSIHFEINVDVTITVSNDDVTTAFEQYRNALKRNRK